MSQNRIRTFVLTFGYIDDIVDIQIQTVNFLPNTDEIKGVRKLASYHIKTDSVLLYTYRVTEI